MDAFPHGQQTGKIACAARVLKKIIQLIGRIFFCLRKIFFSVDAASIAMAHFFIEKVMRRKEGEVYLVLFYSFFIIIS